MMSLHRDQRILRMKCIRQSRLSQSYSVRLAKLISEKRLASKASCGVEGQTEKTNPKVILFRSGQTALAVRF